METEEITVEKTQVGREAKDSLQGFIYQIWTVLTARGSK
jgi:hypothetical protein|tara:strand:- start:12 stop:128 length:117 start_codon:yes stop_codon:yes gene_type:complete